MSLCRFIHEIPISLLETNSLVARKFPAISQKSNKQLLIVTPNIHLVFTQRRLSIIPINLLLITCLLLTIFKTLPSQNAGIPFAKHKAASTNSHYPTHYSSASSIYKLASTVKKLQKRNNFKTKSSNG